MSHRFFTTTSLATNDIVLTDEAQIHQISRVLRFGVGDTFILNEDNGEDVEVEITSIEKKEMRAKVLSRAPAWRPTVNTEIYLATIRKERFEWALEKCTELGVSKIIPLSTDRAERGSVPRPRAERILNESAEQCGRGNIPEYGDALELEHAISAAVTSGKIVLACVHNGTSFGSTLTNLPPNHLTGLLILIGPEGGWTPAELALFKKYNVTEVSLGPTNLRAETAAVAACAMVHMHAK